MTQKNSVLVRYPVRNSTSSVRVFIRVNAVYVFSSISLRCFLILSYDLLIDLPSSLFPSGFPQQKLLAFIVFAYVPQAQPISSLLDHSSNICWEKSRSSLPKLVSSEMWLCSLVEQVPSLLCHWYLHLQDTCSRRFLSKVDTCLPDHTWSGLRHDLITVPWAGPEALQSGVY